MIERIQQNNKNLENVSPLPPSTFTKTASYYCVQCMLAEGAQEGARNFCLGRIVNYFKVIKGYTKENALKEVQLWNRKCNPPKSPSIINADFERYWEGNYKLLGCEVPDKNDQQILNRYCDKYNCTTIFEQKANGEVEAEEMLFDNNILKNKVMRDLTGFHFMILSVLDFVDKPLTKKKLVNHLTGRKTKKCCICDDTLSKDLAELVKRKFIIYDDMTKSYSINRKTYKPTYTRYSYSATIQLINKIISPCEYLTYLCLVRNLQQNRNVTCETIADDLNKDDGNVSRYIIGLHKTGLINVTTSYNSRGVPYNTYKILY